MTSPVKTPTITPTTTPTPRPDDDPMRAPEICPHTGATSPLRFAGCGTMRPWCCPEPSCTPVLNFNVESSGESFICFGKMIRPLEFTYDGHHHKNDLNHCDYTALKGVIRWQENRDDWVFLLRAYTQALKKLDIEP